VSHFFLICAVFGGGVLLLQLALTLFGLGDHDVGGLDAGHTELAHHGGDSDPRGGLNLFSVRSISAGLAFFGLTGLATLAAGWAWWLALPAALVPAMAAMALVAYLMRSLLRLESDGGLKLENALGAQATVYIPIPGAEGGQGRITFALQNRTVELPAVTLGERLATGTPVTVVDIRAGDLLEVVPSNPLHEDP
jgi:hypothetical protein